MNNKLKFIVLEERIVLDAAATAVIYVNSHNTSSIHDGTSWAHAYNNLQDALAKAASTPGPDQVWIAQGTYKPGTTTTATFNLPDNVTVYGGFQGNETKLFQRDPAAHPTILSGDVLSNDLTNPLNPADPHYASQLSTPAYLAYLASKADNTLHVITAIGVTASLDGLQIVAGFANGLSHPNDQGGGLLVSSGARVTLNNDILTLNASNFNGGAVQADGAGTTLTVTKSVFTKNQEISPIVDSAHGGGALSLTNGALANISNSLFSMNQSGEDGGAIRLSSSNMNLSDSVLINNQTSRSGGALATLDIFNPTLTTINICNTLFQNNTGLNQSSFGGAIFAINIFGNSDSIVNITNSNFIKNSNNVGGAIEAQDRNILVDNSNFIGNSAGDTGGAIFNGSGFNQLFGIPVINTLTVKNSNFINNNVLNGDQATHNAFWAGVGLIFFGTPATELAQGGGAIFNTANLNISNSNFVANSVVGAGVGGAIVSGGQIIEFPTFSIAYTANAVIENSTFLSNSSQNNGGAIAGVSAVSVSTPGVPTLTLKNSTLLANRALHNGGGLYLDQTIATVKNNLFVADNAASGRGIFASNSTTNTFATNTPAALASLISTNQLIIDDIVLI